MFPTPQHSDSGGFPVLPAGWFRASIDEIKNEEMKSGNGEKTRVVVSILSEGYVGRKAFLAINSRHSNPTTEGIGQRQIDALLEATGYTRTTLQSYVQLQRKFVLVKLKIKPAQNGYGTQNDLVTFAKADAVHELVPPPWKGAQGAPPAWHGAAPANPAQPAQQPMWKGAQPQQAEVTSGAIVAPPAQQAVPAPAPAAGSTLPPWKR